LREFFSGCVVVDAPSVVQCLLCHTSYKLSLAHVVDPRCFATSSAQQPRQLFRVKRLQQMVALENAAPVAITAQLKAMRNFGSMRADPSHSNNVRVLAVAPNLLRPH
jgi:hypothetical protein